MPKITPSSKKKAKPQADASNQLNRRAFQPNIIMVMVDDAGMAQFEQYADQNQWPEGYVYPRMDWLSKLVNGGIRYTQCRVAARCTPTRACMMTGRHAHVSPTHEGNGMGDIQTQSEPFSGLNPEHWPYPRTATASGTPYSMAHFGKFHLSRADSRFEPDPRATVDQGHFPEAWEQRLRNPGSGTPNFGFIDFPEHIVTLGSLETIDPVKGVFLETHTAQRVMDWIAEQGPNRPFFAQWWMNQIHSVLPAIEVNIGPGGAPLHQTLSFEQQAPAAEQADGSGDPEYPCNVLWRRALTNLESVDSLCAIVEASMTPEQRANTLWIFCSDNGLHGTDIEPYEDSLFSGPPLFTNVLPPTRDGTPKGTPFHHYDHAKGTLYEEGCRIPLVIGGDVLPPSVRGSTNESLIEAVDFYPTLLDMLAPKWRDTLRAEDVLRHVDGESFIQTLQGETLSREISFSHVYRPPQVNLGQELWFQRKAVNRAGWALLWKFDGELTPGQGIPGHVFELYNLNVDPTERNDLFGTLETDDEAATHYAELKAEIDRRLDL